MNEALVHRGPDDSGYFVGCDIALAMRRLAIIDVERGRQPMRSADGRMTIVFNGEIYNFRAVREGLERRGCQFATDCDTEVVLRAFETGGLEGIKALEGMFAFAVWDEQDRTLTLARDWMGQKSLFYARTARGLAFASEIKALLTIRELERTIDLGALSHYMSLRYLPDRSTLFAGIEKLPPAHALVVTEARTELVPLWKPSYEPKWSFSEADLLDELDRTMAQVVGEHLMSDVPLGCFLSGGIDSSLVVAYAAKAASSRVRTFCIGVSEEAQNELPWAREVAQLYGTDHHEEIVEPNLAQLTPRMAAALEEPVDPFGAGVYVAAHAASSHVTVALGGDGGDELFAGYDRYRGQGLAEAYSQLPALIRRDLLRPILRRFPDDFQYNSLAARLRWLDRVADFDGPRRYAESAAFLRFGHALKAELFEPEAWKTAGAVASERLLDRYFCDGCAETFLDRMLHADCMTRLAENDLPTTDRMTMAHSLELRSPFLDRRIASLAMHAPSQWKIRRGQLKHLTRRLAERHLPHSVARRPKKGFGFPIALWLRGPLRGVMQDIVNRSRLVAAGVFRRQAWQKLLDEHAQGGIDHNYRLWMLFNLEIFWRHFFEGQSVESLEAWMGSRHSMV